MDDLFEIKIFHHRGGQKLGFYFPKNAPLLSRLRRHFDLKWSATYKCWYTPYTDANREKAIALPGFGGINESIAEKPASKPQEPRLRQKPKRGKGGRPQEKMEGLWPENRAALEAFRQQLILKGYSKSTQKTYLAEFAVFARTLRNTPADSLSPGRLKDYFQYCIDQLKLSENTLHSRINALKFYYEQVLGREKFFHKIPRPKKPLLLPKLLSEDEVARLFNALTNKKHKAMLFTTYSAGLRVSELANLRISDIDSGRMQIFIARGKGKKDRVVNLSPVLLDILRQYISTYNPKPVYYLFESDQTKKKYPVRTIQKIFSDAKAKAGILKEVGIHSLRHSFATHLLDKGTDIRYIKDLLGHFNIKTTEIYLHVSRHQLVNVISPFDDLMQNHTIEW